VVQQLICAEKCDKPKRASVRQRLESALVQKLLKSQQKACYVLITCGEPSKEGKMEVELTVEGDRDLACYLIDSAQGYLDDQVTPHEEATS
jgi:hypothetical protein